MSDWSMWWALVKAALLLVGLLLAARYLPVFVAKMTAGAPKRQRYLHLVDSLYIGQERSVHLVDVAGERLVLGVSRAGIQLLLRLPQERETGAVAGDEEGQSDAAES